MKQLMTVACAAALALAATPAAAAYIYTPTPAYETTEGAGNNSVFSRNQALHLQWWFDASIFGEAPLLISAVSLRYDKMVGGGGDYRYVLNDSFRIRADTLDAALSSTYANNLPSPVTVMSGARTIVGHVGAPPGQTKPFGLTFTFDQPYRYDPAEGNLVLDLLIPSQPLFGTMDYASGSRLMSRLYGTDPTVATAPVRTTSFGPVARFDVTSAVPEPASWALMIAGFGAAGAVLRQGRRRRAVA